MSFNAIDEDCRRRFEQARRASPAAGVEEFLPAEDSAAYGATLEELVLIDLEFGWKRVGDRATVGPRVESYLARFPRLNERDVALRLLRYEYERRSAVGPAPSLDEYRNRFPQWILTGREVVDDVSTSAPAGLDPTLPHDRARVKLEAANQDKGLPTRGHVLLAASESGEATPRYSLTRLHAEGGLGRVWVAHDGTLDREVALKELKPQTAPDADAWRRFLREAQVTGRLEHPNIVPVYELNRRDDRQPFYTMRLVKGKTLREATHAYHDRRRARRADPLDLPRLLQAFVSVCQAVSYAHSQGVIHRDLKPDNIILGDFGEVLLLDWGLAKSRRPQPPAGPVSPAAATTGSAAGAPGAADSVEIGPTLKTVTDAALAAELTTQGVVGTPAYMAPEQAGGRADEIDERTDVFGLGGVLFEILTDRPPRSGTNVRALVTDAALRPVPHARQFDPQIPAALDAVCARALAHDPRRRYAAAVDLAQDVQRYLADEPTGVHRESLPRRAARWSRKHRTAVAVSATAALLGLAAVVVGLFVRQDLENARLLRHTQKIAELQAGAAVDQALALSELRQGRFSTAAGLLNRTMAGLVDAPELDDVRARIAAQRDRTERIDRFYRGIELGEQLEFFEYDDRAEAAVDSALRTLGVFEAADWWQKLPADDLAPAQFERLREDVFRQLLLLGAIRAKRGLVDFGAADSAHVYHSVLDMAGRASAWRPSQSARVLEVFGRVGLGPLEALKLGFAREIEPTSQADLYFVGLMKFWFGQGGDSVSKLLNVLQPFTGMNFSDATAQSERMLRTAVARDPSHYWTWFFLGWTKLHVEDYPAAEMAYDACITLRPESAIGHAYRGLSILIGARKGKNEAIRAAEYERGLADVARAEALDPYNPDIVWLHARGRVIADRPAEATAALFRWLDCEPPLADWVGQRVEVEKRRNLADLRALAGGRSQADPNDVAAWILSAEGALRVDDFAAADRAVAEALRQTPDDPRALTIRGRLALARGKTVEAAADFERGLVRDPSHWAALYGRAAARAATGGAEQALLDFATAGAAARTDWQRAAVYRERVRLLARLGRTAEADRTLAAGRLLDPRLIDPRNEKAPR